MRQSALALAVLLSATTFFLTGCDEGGSGFNLQNCVTSGLPNRVICYDDAEIVYVPDDFATPQQAIDTSEPGMLVRIRPGVYTELITRFPDSPEFPRGLAAGLHMKEGVWVEGVGDPGTVVFRDTTGADTTYGAAFVNTSNATGMVNLSFEGFGIGVVVQGGEGRVLCSRVADSKAGIWTFRAEAPWIIGNLVEDCAFDGLLNQIADAIILFNLARRCGAGAGAEVGGEPVFQWNILCQNGLGLSTNTTAAPLVAENVIIDNTIAGVMTATGASPIVVQNDFYGNEIDIRVDFYDDAPADTILATSNFWDSVDLEDIELNRIYDRNDDMQSGAFVRFLPISPSSWSVFSFSPRARCRDLTSAEAMDLLRLEMLTPRPNSAWFEQP